MSAAPSPPATRSTLRWIGRIASYSALLLAVFAALVLVVIPMATGSQTYTVLTGSMQPNYPPGTLIVVKPVAAEQLAIGDVVTYQMNPGQPEVVTHRITGFGVAQDGQRTFATQGDANNSPDDRAVLPVQVRGKLFYSVPVLGYAANWLNQGFDQVGGKGPIILLLVGLLFAYGLFMFVQAWRERRKNNKNNKNNVAAKLAQENFAEDETETEDAAEPVAAPQETRRMRHART